MNSIKNEAVLIVGCGWVGKKLGHFLSQNDHTVYGTTRSQANFKELEAHNIIPIQLELPVNNVSDIQLPEVDSIVISISPGRGEDRDHYPAHIRQLAQLWDDGNAQFIMYSSTSAYGNTKGEVTEDDVNPDPKSKNMILAAEGELRQQVPEAVILRLSGLYGEDRHPAKYMAGRTGISDGDAPVNLIHRDDVIQVTQKIIDADIHGEIFNVCSELHPSRADIYPLIANRLGLKEPTFHKGGAEGKIVSPKKLMDHIDINLLHPDPKEYLAD